MNTEIHVDKTPVGEDTMTPAVRSAWRYHRWVFENFRPFIKKHVLEIGTGHGIYTTYLADIAVDVMATDVDGDALAVAKARVTSENVSFSQLDLTSGEDFEALGIGRFDTVVCLNVMEHIEDDQQATNHLAGALAPGGHVILYVPAGPKLYNALDGYAGHYRRYTPETLRAILAGAGLEVVNLRYSNLVGALGWWVYGKVFKPKTLADDSVNFAAWFFDRVMIPISRVIDRLTAHSIGGQSLLGVARKPD